MKPHRWLNSPLRTFFFCIIFAFFSLLLNGGWMNLYSLDRDRHEMRRQIEKIHDQLGQLDGRIKRAQDPSFIERQALDQLDMASDQDLVFVFSE